MEVKYNKRELRKVEYSAIFALCMIILFVVLSVRDADIAIIIVAAPLLVVSVWKIIDFFYYVYMQKKKEYYYIKLTDSEIICQAIDGMRIIKLKDLKFAQLQEDGLYLHMHEKLTIQEKRIERFLKYYIPDERAIYKIPLFCDRHDMEIVFESIKSRIEKENEDANKESILKYVNIISAYIFIIAGVLVAFPILSLWNKSLFFNVCRFLLFIVGMLLVHKADHKSLSSGDISLGLLIRCIGGSLLIAQYIICACKIEEFIKHYVMDYYFSKKTIAVLITIYFLVFLLYIPKNGLGKRFMLYCIKKKEK